MNIFKTIKTYINKHIHKKQVEKCWQEKEEREKIVLPKEFITPDTVYHVSWEKTIYGGLMPYYYEIRDNKMCILDGYSEFRPHKEGYDRVVLNSFLGIKN